MKLAPALKEWPRKRRPNRRHPREMDFDPDVGGTAIRDAQIRAGMRCGICFMLHPHLCTRTTP